MAPAGSKKRTYTQWGPILSFDTTPCPFKICDYRVEIVASYLGVGFARGLGAVNRRVTRNIFGSWLATVPAAAGMAMLLFVLGHGLGVDAFLRQLMPAAPPVP